MAGFFKKLIQRFTKPDIDWDDLEAQLIQGDLGARLAMQISEELQDQQRSLHGQDIIDVTKKHISNILPKEVPALKPLDGRPKVILMVGVNGTGKTTSSAKLAQHLKGQGYKVLLAAADTFRAAAVEQLEVWAERIDVPLIKGAPNADPSAVCFDAYGAAIARGVDFLICDTAGRLHNRHNLMEELSKIRRTIAKKDPAAPHEVFMVVDATTGGNALQQTKDFNKITPLTGMIVTKLDGSGKGGVLVAIQQELGIPTRFVGTGEQASDFKAFQPQEFLDQLL